MFNCFIECHERYHRGHFLQMNDDLGLGLNQATMSIEEQREMLLSLSKIKQTAECWNSCYGTHIFRGHIAALFFGLRICSLYHGPHALFLILAQAEAAGRKRRHSHWKSSVLGVQPRGARNAWHVTSGKLVPRRFGTVTEPYMP